MKKFIKICKKDQMELKGWLEKLLKAKYKDVINEDGFLYARGDGKTPILLTAHMDTVHKETCREVNIFKGDGATIISSPQGIGGDDRCGIWMIYMILKKTKYRPSILFCEDEEIGGVGSEKFTETQYINELRELKYLVELDRANHNDAVYYDCGNLDFQDYIADTIGYKDAYGSFSDIGHLSPECDKASVNLSCGYYKAHTTDEYVIFEEMFNTFKAVKKLCALAKESEAYDYQEDRPYNNLYEYGLFGGNYNYNYNYDDDEIFLEEEKSTYEIVFKATDGKEDYYYVDAVSYEEALGYWMLDNPTRCYGDLIDYSRVDDIGLKVG